MSDYVLETTYPPSRLIDGIEQENKLIEIRNMSYELNLAI